MPVQSDGRVLGSAPRYVELPPSPALAPWVACYWSIRATDTASVPNRVLPDGCADVIAGLGDHPRPLAIGVMSTADVVPLSGRVDMFGVRFRPGAALAFLDVPLRELTDRRVSLDALWSGAADGFAELLTLARLEARVTCAEGVLHRRLRARKSAGCAEEALVARAIELLCRAGSGSGVRELVAALGVGERRLERVFDRFVGLSPKVLARVIRFRRAVREIERLRLGRSQASWAALAFTAGYADQSHLIREFKALAGVTPARYAAERRAVGFVQYREPDPA